MRQAPAPTALGATGRSATPHDDGADASPREDRAPDGSQKAPTHTVVFFPPVLGGAKPRPGRGLVLDEQWAVTAKFTAGTSVDMIGTCGGLLCLLDVRSCAVRISNPATGESLALPPSPCTSTRRDPRAYCLGFDATTKLYKIVHVPHDYKTASSVSTEKKGVVYVHRVGDKYWRPVRAPGAAACCLAAAGAVYWLTHYEVARARLVRFHLSQEEATLVEPPPFDVHRRPLYCRLLDADAAPCVVTSVRHNPTSGEPFAASNDDINMWRLGDDGRWSLSRRVQLRGKPRHVPGPHAVRHGDLLLQGEDGALYAHRIKERGVSSIERAGEKMLVEGRGAVKTLSDAASPCGRGEDRARVKQEVVAAILGIVELPLYRERLKEGHGETVDRNLEKARADCPVSGGGRYILRTFGYAEPVSTGPLANKSLGLGASGWTRGGCGSRTALQAHHATHDRETQD
jgi:F-box interacting protein